MWENSHRVFFFFPTEWLINDWQWKEKKRCWATIDFYPVSCLSQRCLCVLWVSWKTPGIVSGSVSSQIPTYPTVATTTCKFLTRCSTLHVGPWSFHPPPVLQHFLLHRRAIRPTRGPSLLQSCNNNKELRYNFQLCFYFFSICDTYSDHQYSGISLDIIIFFVIRCVLRLFVRCRPSWPRWRKRAVDWRSWPLSFLPCCSPFSSSSSLDVSVWDHRSLALTLKPIMRSSITW